MAHSICAAPDCSNRMNARGWCPKHYARWKRTGKLTADVLPHGTPAERLWAKVDRSAGPDACWPFMGQRTRGYGSLRVSGTARAMAHRLAYELTVGPIPDGLQIDHLCAYPPCCNPTHLEPVSAQENVRRERERRGQCPMGHPYNSTHVSVWGGARYCRTCRNARRRKPGGRGPYRSALALAVTYSEGAPA